MLHLSVIRRRSNLELNNYFELFRLKRFSWVVVILSTLSNPPFIKNKCKFHTVTRWQIFPYTRQIYVTCKKCIKSHAKCSKKFVGNWVMQTFIYIKWKNEIHRSWFTDIVDIRLAKGLKIHFHTSISTRDLFHVNAF